MSLDIWFKEDIKNIILAAEQANAQALQSGLGSTDPQLQRAYHQGFRAALSTLALAFGLAPLPLHDPHHEQCTIVEVPVPSQSEGPTAPGPRLHMHLPDRFSLRRSFLIIGADEEETP